MKDPGQPAASDEAMAEVFQAFAPGTPLADEVESLLASGPVPVDERELDAAADRLSARLSASEGPTRRQAEPPNTSWLWPAVLCGVGVASILAIGVGVATQGSMPSVGPPPSQVAEVVEPAPPDAPVVSTEALELSADAVATIRGDTLRLQAGQVAFRREGGLEPSVQAVELVDASWVLRPVGTLFAAGTHEDHAAVSVRSGVVRVQRDGDEIARLSAGQWLVTGPDGEVRFSDGQHPTLDAASTELVRQLRWIALPRRTREALDDE